MIREIAAKSSGAQIKIMSSKEDEKELQDCVVTIAGSLKNKQDACSIIIEQLESFKTGAPPGTVNKHNDREVSRNPERPYEKEASKYGEKSYDKERQRSMDRPRNGRESPERHLNKRQEFKRHERSRSAERFNN